MASWEDCEDHWSTLIECCVCETVYVKLDAPDTLLLSGNVCHTLKTVSYHPNVQPASDNAEPDNQPNVQPVARRGESPWYWAHVTWKGR